MKAQLLFMVSIVFTAQSSMAQTFGWAAGMGGGPYDGIYGESVKTDAAGNVYVAGEFFGTVDLDPGPGVYDLIASGSDDAFVAKLSAGGNLLWAVAIGAADYDAAIAVNMAVDGNLLVAGYFEGTVDFDPGPSVFNLTATGGDAFILKLDTAGHFAWAKSISDSDEAAINALKVDASGNIYACGSYTGVADFDPGPGNYNLASNGDRDIFILKLDASGNFLWARSIGSTGYDYAAALDVDATGSVYSTGGYIGSVDFDPGLSAYYLNAGSYENADVLKLDASGNFVWVRSLGGANGNDEGSAIALDAVGNVYSTGNFEGTADFDPGLGIYNLFSNGDDDNYISKLNASGNFVWARSFGNSDEDMVFSIAVDAAGNVFSAGDFKNTVDFDPGVATYNLTANGYNDFFISKLNAFGDFVWATATGGSNYDGVTSLCLNASGNVFSTGYFSSTVDFDPGASIYNIIGTGYGNLFVQQLSQPCSISSVTITPSGTFTACSHVPVTLTVSSATGIVYQWYKGNNPLAGETNNTYITTKKGNFSVTESDGVCSVSSSQTKIVRNPVPVANVTALGDLNICSAGSVSLKVNPNPDMNYQWRKDGIELAGATKKKYVATEVGDYTVSKTNSVTGCSDTSAVITVYMACKQENIPLHDDVQMNIYPNPADGNFVVAMHFVTTEDGEADIQLFNLLGQSVYLDRVGVSNGELVEEVNLDAAVPAGQYVVRVVMNGKAWYGKMVYQK